MWPTPHASASTGAGTQGRDGGLNLQTAVGHWPTPGASDGDKGPVCFSRGNPSLGHAAKNWPTPRTPSGGPETCSSKAKRGTGGEDLQTTAELWNTPKATADKHGRPRSDARGDLQAQAICHSSRPAPDPEKSGLRSSQIARTSRPRLNWMFVEWLMGFPPAWIGYGPSAMELCLWQRRMRCSLSWLVSMKSDEPQLTLF